MTWGILNIIGWHERRRSVACERVYFKGSQRRNGIPRAAATRGNDKEVRIFLVVILARVAAAREGSRPYSAANSGSEKSNSLKW